MIPLHGAWYYSTLWVQKQVNAITAASDKVLVYLNQS